MTAIAASASAMALAHSSPPVSSVGSAEVHAAPKGKARNFSIDRARTFLTLVVLLHHAVIPYTYFGHTDPKSWIGFDMIVLATDSFFMAMFFFLSGLFVWPGIARTMCSMRTPVPAICQRRCMLAGFA